ncbi:MAG: hypothetical protein R3B53_01825 [Candidatus Paceibacterota bacterium]
MYAFLIVTFLLGAGVGVYLSRHGLFGLGNSNNLSSDNPFLNEADTEEADELRAESALSIQTRIQKRKMRILAKAEAEGRITNDGVEDLFCISDNTAGRYLTQLVKENHLTKVGTTGRGVYYEPVKVPK